MDTRIDRINKFAEMHSQARKDNHKTQSDMAKALGITIKTVQSWEKGLSSPSFFQSLEWFRVLGLNPLPFYTQYVYPDLDKGLNNENEEDIEKTFKVLTDSVSPATKHAINYVFFGQHGASPNAVLQMVLAYLHTPLHARIATAMMILNTFSMHEDLDLTICNDNIQPVLDILDDAIISAKQKIGAGSPKQTHP